MEENISGDEGWALRNRIPLLLTAYSWRKFLHSSCLDLLAFLCVYIYFLSNTSVIYNLALGLVQQWIKCRRAPLCQMLEVGYWFWESRIPGWKGPLDHLVQTFLARAFFSLLVEMSAKSKGCVFAILRQRWHTIELIWNLEQNLSPVAAW